MKFKFWTQSIGLLLACFVAVAAQAGSLQQVLRSGELRVGITLAPPWALRNEERELVGFEIDVARKLANDMEVEVRFLTYDHDELVRALEANEIDLIAAGLTISPARALHVNFSRPYATGGIGIATNTSSTADVGLLEQLDAPGFAVAVLANSAAAELAARLFPRAELLRFVDENQATEALLSGDADIYLGSEPIPSFLEIENPTVVDVPVNRPLLETPWAFAVGKGDPDFVFFLDAWIEARRADTWLDTTHEYWFKTLQWRD